MEAKINEKLVVIFQGDSSENNNKFVNTLKDEGINANHIPILSFKFINIEKLKICLENPNDYSGIIFTSSRAVNAVACAVKFELYEEYWKEKLNFSVGEATSKMVLLHLNHKTHVSDSGNSSNLCEMIIQICKNIDKPLLFPCSYIRKDTIPETLFKNNIPLKEMCCYDTEPNPKFKEMWENLIAKNCLPNVLVFFSPSGVKYCFETVVNSYSEGVEPKFVALGPSTKKALLDIGAEICKVAEKPNPEAVLHVVKEFLYV